MRNAHKSLVEKPEDEGLAGRIILKYILRNKVGNFGVDIFSLGQETAAETFDDRIRPSGSISAGKFLGNVRDCSRLNIDPAVWA